MRSLQELGDRDLLMRGGEWIRFCRLFAAERGNLSNTLERAEHTRAPRRVIDAIKATVPAGSSSLGSPSAWGSELQEYKKLAEGFISSLRGRSVFFTLLGDNAFYRAPLRTALVFATSSAAGSITEAGKPKPLARFDLAAANLQPVKAIATIVTTEELLRDGGSAGEAAFSREIRGAVTDAVDSEFFSLISQSLTPLA